MADEQSVGAEIKQNLRNIGKAFFSPDLDEREEGAANLHAYADKARGSQHLDLIVAGTILKAATPRSITTVNLENIAKRKK